MTKGLRVSIYSSEGDCSNGGISSRVTHATLTGPNVSRVFEPTDDAPEIELQRANIGPGFKAVPKEHGQGIGPMFGGCFIYTSDSRFPSDAPIALHDRWESQEIYDANF